ncbi:hypothetical protein C8R44DRAFT_742611 [Mycena epipterygia]|nr:hypothetical protein C8R44DRAFT_742611 [Mycena epipterygia]
MLDDAKLVKHFPGVLKALKKRIKSLPDSLPLAQAEGPLARYLGELEIDAEEGSASTANRQWERAFQVSTEEQSKRIARREYGLDLVCPFLEFFSQQEGVKETDAIGMLGRRIHQLNKILDSIYYNASQRQGNSQGKVECPETIGAIPKSVWQCSSSSPTSKAVFSYQSDVQGSVLVSIPTSKAVF